MKKKDITMKGSSHSKLLYLQFLLLLFLSICSSITIEASENLLFPVLYKGRYRPSDAYARLWLYERYHATTLKSADLTAFKTTTSYPLDLLWALEIAGHVPYSNAPLFWIKTAELKKSIGVPLKQNRFSYHELHSAINSNQPPPTLIDKRISEEWSSLLFSLKEFEGLLGSKIPIEDEFEKRLKELEKQKLPPKEIGRLLEQDFPLIKRLETAGSLFKVLPSKYKQGDWFPLKALQIQIYDLPSKQLKFVGNFTQFSDNDFEAIRQNYFKLTQTFTELNQDDYRAAKQSLSEVLLKAYETLAGSVIQQVHGKQLSYPTLTQLKIESLYVQYHWIPFLIFIYGLGGSLVLISYRQQWRLGHVLALWTIFFAVICHTILLLMRCYILERPPVSNMFETVIYVPWVAACATLLLPMFRKNPLTLLAACITSICLLVILEVTDLNQNLDQVQAVLDSQFWLLIHVLLVVGSYGIFILGAILGHFYLGMFIANHKETNSMKSLASMILQTMYAGTAMLVAGTILGGIWAAESWGRFWDWDPKESWAFISSCFYLIWIHAYRFHRIASFGLAIGSVGGLLAISFTWYGVNYILGTGLHSYGFGSGGDLYYYAFLAIECLFIGTSLWRHSKIS